MVEAADTRFDARLAILKELAEAAARRMAGRVA